jgi:CAAX prenyl protease-like protein
MTTTSDRGPAPDHGPAEPWLTCVAPLALFLAAGALEPTPSGGLLASLGIPYAAYPVIYCVRVAATALLLARFWPALGPWLGRPRWWPPLVGLALVVVWVGLAKLQHTLGWTFAAGERSSFNPFLPDTLGDDPARAWAFLAIRLAGMVVIVPIVEEIFLRGFLMRYVIDEQFWRVPFGTLTAAAAATCGIYAVASHPGEALAALSWFAAVSLIARATRQPIDCILCHAATNLALAAYVITTGEWWLM